MIKKWIIKRKTRKEKIDQFIRIAKTQKALELDQYYSNEIKLMRKQFFIEIEIARKEEKEIAEKKIKVIENKLCLKIAEQDNKIKQKNKELKKSREAWNTYKDVVVVLKSCIDSLQMYAKLEWEMISKKYQKISTPSDKLEFLQDFIDGKKGEKIEKLLEFDELQ